MTTAEHIDRLSRCGTAAGPVTPPSAAAPAAGAGAGAPPENARQGSIEGDAIAGLAHELRTPLTSISNSAALLERSLAGSVDESTRLVLGILVKETRRVSALLSEFLALGRPPAPRPVPTDLNRLIIETVAIARASRPQAGRVPVELALAADLPPAPVDPEQLKQVLLNLLVNGLDACTAGPEFAAGARLTVSTAGPTAGPTAGAGHWLITVADTGPGVAPEDRARIFEPFFTRKANGTGLGLAISRRIVEAHGGRIEVTGRRWNGAVFTVVLPARTGTVGENGARARRRSQVAAAGSTVYPEPGSHVPRRGSAPRRDRSRCRTAASRNSPAA